MSDKDYNVNFFKPRTDHAKANMKVVLTMIIIWAVAVFGFQILLAASVKPTAEKAYKTFKQIWPAINEGSASPEQEQEFARVTLMVLGKHIVLKDKHKKILQNSLNKSVKDLLAKADSPDAEAAIGLGENGFDPLLKDILAASLAATPADTISADEMKEIPAIMQLYLVHNRSILTDTRFLGFPFHYWYTAQFLLILFVGLCWLFCRITDKSNKTFALETE